jgi:hypothetical protein
MIRRCLVNMKHRFDPYTKFECFSFSYTGINLSTETKFLPSRQFQRKFVYLNLAALKRKSFTHVILRVKPTREMVSAHTSTLMCTFF